MSKARKVVLAVAIFFSAFWFDRCYAQQSSASGSVPPAKEQGSIYLLLFASGSLGTAVVGAIIAGAYSLRAKRNEYLNDYYSLVMKKRIAAYEEIEKLIIMLKLTALGEDRKPYHLLFANENDRMTAYTLAANITAQALWISEEARTEVRGFSDLIFPLSDFDGGPVEFGKAHYRTIADFRDKLERIVARDLLRFPNVKAFLKSKYRREPGEYRSFDPGKSDVAAAD